MGRVHRGAGAVIVCAGLAAPVTLSAQIQVEDPFARATPPGQGNSAAYAVIHNDGEEDRSIVAGESPAAETVELHTHSEEDGVMRMREVESIELPAAGQVALEPGGLHIMLIDLVEALEPGERIDITLILDDGSRLDLRPEIRHHRSIDVGQDSESRGLDE